MWLSIGKFVGSLIVAEIVGRAVGFAFDGSSGSAPGNDKESKTGKGKAPSNVKNSSGPDRNTPRSRNLDGRIRAKNSSTGKSRK